MLQSLHDASITLLFTNILISFPQYAHFEIIKIRVPFAFFISFRFDSISS